jgi:uncharacterized protein YacL
VIIAVVSALGAFLVSSLIDYAISRLSARAALGMALGLVIASLTFFAFNLLVSALYETYGMPEVFGLASKIVVPVMFLILFYLGVTIGITKGTEIIEATARKAVAGVPQTAPKILDTSVIIDGRIADVAEAGFIEGVMIIPKFVIKELQYIADSGDPMKRVRGRRGLDVLKRMQQDIPGVTIKITNHDFPKVKEVDLKLVELAKKLGGFIITNDFNLNKVAAIHGVKALNLNQLANALKPVVLPGETMSIRVVKEGKEENQGVGYLEDGTMVVVDDAKNYVGKDIDVAVTSVLQTPTGRMIFSKVKEESTGTGY